MKDNLKDDSNTNIEGGPGPVDDQELETGVQGVGYQDQCLSV
jgi:hypothetical protein